MRQTRHVLRCFTETDSLQTRAIKRENSETNSDVHMRRRARPCPQPKASRLKESH
jgi:hypothetical protein